MPIYATWDPAHKAAEITLSGGNLTATSSLNDKGVRSTIGVSIGKWYWEIVGLHLAGTGHNRAGVVLSTYSTSAAVGDSATDWGYQDSGNGLYSGGTIFAGAAYTDADVIGLALDVDAQTLDCYKNNVLQGTFHAIFGTIYAAVSLGNDSPTDTFTANFGASAFTYSPPAGFNAGLYTPDPPSTIVPFRAMG